MVRLFDQYNIRHIFEPGFPGLVEAFYVQERLVEQLMPEVHTAFVRFPFSSLYYDLCEGDRQRMESRHRRTRRNGTSPSSRIQFRLVRN